MRTMTLLLLLACSSEKTTGKDPEPAKTRDAGTAELVKKKVAVPPNSGLAAKDNDPAVVALAKAAITCKVDGDRLEYSCPGYSAWRDSALLKDNKADKTLVNLLEDPDEKVRFLGAEKLDGISRDDPAAAKRVLAAAQRETSELVGEALGKALGRVDMKKAGIVDAVNKLIAEHPLPALRDGLMGAGAHANSAEVFDAVFAQAKTAKNDRVRMSAVRAFWVGTPSDKAAEVCALWLDSADDAHAETAGEAAYMCGLRSDCKPQWDALLAKIEGKAKDGKVKHMQMASALEWLWKQKEATAPQKDKAVAVAKAIVENAKNEPSTRARAIDVLANVDKDGKDAKAFAAKFKDDPALKSTVERLMKKP